MHNSRRDRFAGNIKRAVDLFNPSVEADSNTIDVEAEERRVRTMDVWLVLGSVEEFYEDDFTEIPIAKGKELTASVNRFRTIAAEVPKTGPATKKQSDEAKLELLKIAEILGVIHQNRQA